MSRGKLLKLISFIVLESIKLLAKTKIALDRKKPVSNLQMVGI
jgi:hypothetical protein